MVRPLSPLIFLLLFLACNRAPAPVRTAAARELPADFLRGMTFAHEGYRGHNGYGGDLVGPSIDSLKKLNVNAIAIVPYTFMRDPHRIDSLPVPGHYGAENDSAVRFSIRQAHDRGFSIMLKPQIWIRGAWPGEVDFTTDADWDRFFDAYGAWMHHYAVMAEAEGIEALCIGTELVQTTRKHPARWRQLIAELRQVYGGRLTYAANWGEEFEGLSFWEDLDAMGLNSYYPLSTAEAPTDADLLAGARRWMQLADSISRVHERPLWLTEVGYRSVDRAWQNPHAEAADRGESLETQARCYVALSTAARESDRLQAMFVWKWPSYLGHRESRDERQTGFVPGGKPAADILTRLYAYPSTAVTPGS
ncbi:glycoside hydrolase family 113 [Lewinella sp. IMCC34183]|uniref:glycoside hydrolase family 113 n=1 Tax=Lewinella sp. IMCC34183 TaxID=2248762 RepID=UPI000E2864FB|nr:hypothetical protein [Lewinella sp. IMCC34183]